MKLLVVGNSLRSGAERLRLAAAGLALRGHEVLWSGARETIPPPGPRDEDPGAPIRSLRPVPGGFGLARVRAELVLGGGPPVLTARAGWLAGAQSMVLSLDPVAVGRWSVLDRWCWESLDAVGIREAGEPERDARMAALPGSERWGVWSHVPPPAAPSASHPDTEILERLCERTRSRPRGLAPRPAAFLDRDGTLVVEKNYLASPGGLELYPGVPEALRRLQAAGLALVVISNQSGVGRGLFPVERVHQTMARLRILLRGHDIELDGVYFCPHRPDEGCACRKPGTELLARAAADLGLSLRHSVMFGDKLLDVATGQRAGALGVLVRTGYGREEERANPPPSRPPDHVAEDLPAAVAWLIESRGLKERD